MPLREGLDDARVMSDAMLTGSAEAGGDENRRWCDVIHGIPRRGATRLSQLRERSDQGPGIAQAVSSTGKCPVRSSPRARRLSARCSSASSSRRARAAGRRVEQPPQVLQQRGRDRLAAEIPDHRAQLGLGVEATGRCRSRRCGRPAPSRQWPLLRSALLATRSKTQMRRSGSWCSSSSQQREVVLLEVGRHEELERALAERARRAQDGERARGPSRAPPRAGRRRPRAGRARAGSPTAAARRARACRPPARSAPSRQQLDEERGVAAARHAALDGDLAACQQVERDGRIGPPRHR